MVLRKLFALRRLRARAAVIEYSAPELHDDSSEDPLKEITRLRHFVSPAGRECKVSSNCLKFLVINATAVRDDDDDNDGCVPIISIYSKHAVLLNLIKHTLVDYCSSRGTRYLVVSRLLEPERA